jgi:hypothetical protein
MLMARLENNVQFKAIVTFNKSEEEKRIEEAIAKREANSAKAKELLLQAIQLMVESEIADGNAISEDDIAARAKALLGSDILKGAGV